MSRLAVPTTLNLTRGKVSMLRLAARWALERHLFSTIRHIVVQLPEEADTERWAVVAGLREAFGAAVPPVMVASPSRPTLTALWGLLRCTLFGRDATRLEAEAVAVAVSRSNQCPYCVDVHEAAVQHLSTPSAETTVQWAENTHERVELRASPAAVQLLGTALAFHLVNRLVSVFLPRSPFPQAAPLREWSSEALLRLLPTVPPTQPPLRFDAATPFRWASGAVGEATASFAAQAVALGQEFVSGNLQTFLRTQLKSWRRRGGLGDTRGDLTLLRETEYATGALLSAVAFAPWRVTDDLVFESRRVLDTDEALVGAVTWAAWCASSELASRWDLVPP